MYNTLVSSINKNDRHDITEILLKVALKQHNPGIVLQQHFPLFLKILRVYSILMHQ
jgi:hypothetical protein